MDVEIKPTWPTQVWIGQVADPALQQLAGLAEPDTEIDLSVEADGLAVIAELENAVTTALGLPNPQCWQHRLKVWPTGFYRGMTYRPVTARVLVFVASTTPQEHPDSGIIHLHDPRIGAANVGLPGLPWGRPVKVPPMAGGAVAAPGWVGFSIAPLRAGHTMTVWTAETIAGPR